MYIQNLNVLALKCGFYNVLVYDSRKDTKDFQEIILYSTLYSTWGEYQIQPVCLCVFVCVCVCVCVAYACVCISSDSCPIIDLSG